MNKKILIAGLAFLALTGCQSLTEQASNKLAEGIINQATGGKANVDINSGNVTIKGENGETLNINGDKNGGSLTMTDSSGKTVTATGDQSGNFAVKDQNGQTVMQGNQNSVTIQGENGQTYKSGSSKPDNWPSDMPTPDNAAEFYYFTINGSTSATFTLPGTDLKTNCATEMNLITGAGWQTDPNGFTMDSSEGSIRTYMKGDQSLSFSCNTAGDNTGITLQKAAKTPAS